ncbi:MAG: glycosyltransferase family 9 protein [Thermodesulfobacteriota bacterium]|nr:glycosyltransferase family 9 protein [Thermodesulfobacteriota bacterium]
MDILIIKLGAMGDVVNTLPLAFDLKTRLDARICWLIEPLSLPLVKGHPCVDEVIVFDPDNWSDSGKKVIQLLRRHSFDIALDLQRTLKSSLFCLAARAERKIGFDKNRCKEQTWLLPFERIPSSDPGRHMVYQYMEFSSFLGGTPGEIRWAIPVDAGMPFPLPAGYVVLNIGATKTANKWTDTGFACLANAIQQRFHLYSVITGGTQDIPSAKAITSLSGAKIIDLAGKTSITDLKGIIAESRAVISADTGPMHLAVALGKEVIGLFGPSDPSRTGPLNNHVIRHDLCCSPCNQRQCSHSTCMKRIEVQQVMDVLKDLL